MLNRNQYDFERRMVRLTYVIYGFEAAFLIIAGAILSLMFI